jgi:phage pi2 protein 07
MKYGCVFWEFAKWKLATRKDNQHEKRWLRNPQLKVECSVSTAGFGHQTDQQTYLWQFLMEPVIQ